MVVLAVLRIFEGLKISQAFSALAFHRESKRKNRYRFVAIFARHCRFNVQFDLLAVGRAFYPLDERLDIPTVLANKVNVSISTLEELGVHIFEDE